MNAKLEDGRRGHAWVALALCAAVAAAWVLEGVVRKGLDNAGPFAPNWLPLVAAALGAAALLSVRGRAAWPRMQRALAWAGLLLMVWAANGLPFDLLRIVRLIPLPVDWAGMAVRAVTLAAAVALASHILAARPDPASAPARWYGYAAFVLALPYPLLRAIWVFGGTVGLSWPGAAGEGLEAWVISVPWLLAAALSLLLVQPPRWMPRRLLLAAGWFATAVVAMIGPGAFWSLVSAFLQGRVPAVDGIATWVPALFYGSWFLWPIAAGAATWSYQVRSARRVIPAEGLPAPA